MHVRYVLPGFVGLLTLVGCHRPPHAQLDPVLSLKDVAQVPEPPVLEGDLAATLTLEAWKRHPELTLAKAEWDMAKGGIVTAGARPNPSVNLGAAHTGGDPKPWTLGLGLTIPIETAGKREDRLRIARARAEMAALRVAGNAWDLRMRVRQKLLAWRRAVQDLDLAKESRALQAELFQLQDRRFQLGDLGRPERDAALLASQGAEDQVRLVQLVRDRAETDLTQAAGLPPGALKDRLAREPVDSSENLRVSPESPLPPSEALIHRLDVRQTLLSWEMNEATLDLELARRYPNLQLGPGYAWDKGASVWSLGIALELPLLDRRQGPIAEALAGRASLEAELRLRESQALADVERAHTHLEQARARFQALSLSLRTATARRSQVHQAWAAGEVDKAALLGVNLEVLNLRRLLLDAWADAEAARLELEAAFQRSLDPTEKPYSGDAS